MRYHDHDQFTFALVTRGWGCQYNKKLLNIGKIVRSSPVCYGAAGSTGKGGTTTNKHPRWDVWVLDGTREELRGIDEIVNLAHMIPADRPEGYVLRRNDCAMVLPSADSQAGRVASKLANKNNLRMRFYDNGFLSMDPEGLFTREIMGNNQFSKCDPGEMIHPVYMNDRVYNQRMYNLDAPGTGHAATQPNDDDDWFAGSYLRTQYGASSIWASKGKLTTDNPSSPINRVYYPATYKVLTPTTVECTWKNGQVSTNSNPALTLTLTLTLTQRNR